MPHVLLISEFCQKYNITHEYSVFANLHGTPAVVFWPHETINPKPKTADVKYALLKSVNFKDVDTCVFLTFSVLMLERE